MPDFLSFLSTHVQNPWALVLIISAMPFFENRFAIVYGLSKGLNPLLVYLVSSLTTLAVIWPVLKFLNHSFFRNLAHKIFGDYVYNKIEKNKEKLEKYEELALVLFVAVPFVGTGAYTASLISSFLLMDFRKSYFSIAIGVFLAGLISYLAYVGVITIF